MSFAGADGCRARVAGMLKALKGQAPALLRHPSGAAVIDDAFTAASAAQRNAMAAEFYGREFTLFEVRSAGAKAVRTILRVL